MAIYPIEDIEVAYGEKGMSAKYNKLCANSVNSTDDIHPQYRLQHQNNEGHVLVRRHTYGETSVPVSLDLYHNNYWAQYATRSVYAGSNEYNGGPETSCNLLATIFKKTNAFTGSTITPSILLKYERGNNFPSDAPTITFKANKFSKDANADTLIIESSAITLTDDNTWHLITGSEIDISSVAVDDYIRVGVNCVLPSFTGMAQFAGHWQYVYSAILKIS